MKSSAKKTGNTFTEPQFCVLYFEMIFVKIVSIFAWRTKEEKGRGQTEKKFEEKRRKRKKKDKR